MACTSHFGTTWPLTGTWPDVPTWQPTFGKVPSGDVPDVLARHVAEVVRRAIADEADLCGQGQDSVNNLIATLSAVNAQVAPGVEQLLRADHSDPNPGAPSDASSNSAVRLGVADECEGRAGTRSRAASGAGERRLGRPPLQALPSSGTDCAT